MRRTTRLACIMLTIAPATAARQSGTWLLTCPPAEPCLLRLNRHFLDIAGVTADLEVQAASKTPVIALRGLPAPVLLAATMVGQANASMQFDHAPAKDLSCSPTATLFICAPQDAAARRLAAALPAARTAALRLSVTFSGMQPLQIRGRTLDLAGTAEALAKLQTTPQPASATILHQLLKAAGYPNDK